MDNTIEKYEYQNLAYLLRGAVEGEDFGGRKGAVVDANVVDRTVHEYGSSHRITYI